MVNEENEISKNGNKLRILAYKPGLSVQTIKLNRFIRCEPLELEYLYTVLQDYDIHFLDGIVDSRDPIKLAKKLKPDIILITSLITNINTVLSKSRKFKKLDNTPLIFVGGPHAEVIPEHFYDDNIDGVFFANQLEAVTEVVDRVEKSISYTDVAGGAFRVNGEFVKNKSLPLDPLKLPRAKHYLLDQHPNRYNIIYYKPCAAIKTSFGCTDNCTFCFCTKMNAGNYGVRPIDDVVDEIEEISVDNIIVLDDNFLVDRNRLTEFCDLIEKRGIKKEYIIIGGAEFISKNPDIMQRLRRVGVTGVMVGFEFVTDEELKSFNKKTNMEDNNLTISICKECDIDLFALFIVNPDWKHSDFRRLAKYIRSNHMPFALFSTLTVFPGTNLAKSIEPQLDIDSWWRYDLLRLHQQPKYMSALMFYLWVFYLYIIPGMQFASLKKFHQKYGTKGIIRHFFTSLVIGFEYLFKLIIWK